MRPECHKNSCHGDVLTKALLFLLFSRTKFVLVYLACQSAETAGKVLVKRLAWNVVDLTLSEGG